MMICFFLFRYDYENCASAPCNEMIELLRTQLDGSSGGTALTGRSFTELGKTYTVARADDFSYTDPIDGALATKQVTLRSL